MLVGEWLNNLFLGNHAGWFVFLLAPIFLLVLVLFFWVRDTYKFTNLETVLFGGLGGFLIIEYGFLRYSNLFWPLQIFLVIFWLSVPVLMLAIRSKKYDVFLAPLASSIIIFLLALIVSRQYLLSEAIAWLSFVFVMVLNGAILFVSSKRKRAKTRS